MIRRAFFMFGANGPSSAGDEQRRTSYFFFGLTGLLGACVSAEAATLFTGAGVFDDDSSFEAVLATLGEVCSLLAIAEFSWLHVQTAGRRSRWDRWGSAGVLVMDSRDPSDSRKQNLRNE